MSTNILKVRPQKGKTVKIVQVKEDNPVEEKTNKSRKKDKSEKRGEPTEQEETKDESDTDVRTDAGNGNGNRVPGDDCRTGRGACFTVDTERES